MRGYRELIIATIVAAFGLVVFGGVVRVSGSGLGCGPDWPVCNGQVVPTFSLPTAIEYTHRLLAALVTVLTAALVVAGWRERRRGRLPLALSALAMGLVLIQAGLGAVTVMLDLRPWVVMAHLGMAEAYLATVVVLGVVVLAGPHLPGVRLSLRGTWSALGRSAVVAAAAVYVVMLSGAYVSASGASLACTEWPLCGGRYIPTGWTPVDIQLTHRWMVLLATVAVLAVAVRAWRVRHNAPILAWMALAAAVIIVGQSLIGAWLIWSLLPPLARGLHLAVATLLWMLLIALAALDRMARAGAVSVPEAARTPPSIASGSRPVR